MRLLLANPNTDAALTARLAADVAKSLEARDRLEARTAGEGPPFIGSDESIARARQGLARDLADPAAASDAVLLGCFGDLGIDHLRRALARPIVSLSDACFAIAPLIGRRLGIVTTSPYWERRLASDVEARGLSGAITAVRSSFASPPQTTEQLVAACRTGIARLPAEGAEAVVLGGAPLAVLRPDLAAESPIPIVDIVAAATALCRTLATASGTSAA